MAVKILGNSSAKLGRAGYIKASIEDKDLQEIQDKFFRIAKSLKEGTGKGRKGPVDFARIGKALDELEDLIDDAPIMHSAAVDTNAVKKLKQGIENANRFIRALKTDASDVAKELEKCGDLVSKVF